MDRNVKYPTLPENRLKLKSMKNIVAVVFLMVILVFHVKAQGTFEVFIPSTYRTGTTMAIDDGNGGIIAPM
ncbi:MAG: hypothetical protein FD170_3281, partial [Bacteroidetes bacterium]